MMWMHCAVMREAVPPMLPGHTCESLGLKGGDQGLMFEADCEIEYEYSK